MQQVPKEGKDNPATLYIKKQLQINFNGSETFIITVLLLSVSPKTFITLECDSSEEGQLESIGPPEKVDNSAHFPFKLRSKYACPRKSGLSTGSVLIIVFGSLLLVYIVAGILFNKFHRGATGKEVIPNVNFWMDFPLLVKDGVEFSYQFCKKTCGGKRSSYESI